jgi:hypothetical protein
LGRMSTLRMRLGLSVSSSTTPLSGVFAFRSEGTMPAPCVRVIGHLVLSLLLSSVGSANAQDSPPIAEKPSPKVEIGAAISGLLFPSGLAGVGLRISGGNGGRFSVEGAVDWTDAFQTYRDSEQVIWLFFWQVNQTLWSGRNSSRLFVTYGTAGFTGRTFVAPGRLDSWFLPPILPIVGIGGEHVLAKYMAIRGDGQLLVGPFEGGAGVPRISVGVSIPIRGYAR